jgi:lipopolysaccharide transport system ATP-binding protein
LVDAHKRDILFWAACAGRTQAMTSSIDVEGLSLSFPLYHGNARSLKKTVLSTVTGRMAADNRNRVVVEALRDVNLALRPGDRLALVGGNGAGKTTLLRAMAGIYEPVAGRVRVQGSLNALVDPHLGMNPELTGRENIMLRGMYLGLDKKAIEGLAEDVAAFAELTDFLDLPVRIYSSGMIVRLGFALATSVQPQVLLMDEWFLAGDAGFMEKARVRLENLVRGVEILVLSSHVTDVVLQWCTRALWMDQGRVRADGPPAEVLSAYLGHPVQLSEWAQQRMATTGSDPGEAG